MAGPVRSSLSKGRRRATSILGQQLVRIEPVGFGSPCASVDIDACCIGYDVVDA